MRGMKKRHVWILLVVLFLLLAFVVVDKEMLASAKGKDFTVSFGNGGLKNYFVVDNACYVYTINYPKDEKQLSQLMNNVLTSSVVSAKRKFSPENDGFINIRIHWQFIGKEKIIYQVCGDIIKRGGAK